MPILANAGEALDLLNADLYAARGYPHDAWARLRREDPVRWIEPSQGPPYWAITKHEDIVSVSRRPELFRSNPITIPSEPGRQADPEARPEPEVLLMMNPPRHGPMRQVVSRRFTPASLQRISNSVEQIAKEIVDTLATGETVECDFVEKMATPLPIAVLSLLLGVPREDRQLLIRWTHEKVGSHDPEYRKAGETAGETTRRATGELFEYFTRLLAKRRAEPGDDLVSLIAHGEFMGRALTDEEILNYCLILVVAGNETTRHATSGGLLAFIEHPEEWQRLRRNPELLPSAVEEILRWTSPTIHFLRTAAADTEIRGRTIRQGQHVALFYPSANRDADVFEKPHAFRVDRQPNPQIAFGIGNHFCLGAHVARMELAAAYRQLLQRLDFAELAGEPQRLRSNVVGGLKHLPIRYRLRS